MDIKDQVTLADGVAWRSNGIMKARRVGPMVYLFADHLVTTKDAVFSFGPSGDVTNTAIITSIPKQFRPFAPSPLLSGASGRLIEFHARDSGIISVAALAPDSTTTGTRDFSSGLEMSFGGTYMAP